MFQHWFKRVFVWGILTILMPSVYAEAFFEFDTKAPMINPNSSKQVQIIPDFAESAKNRCLKMMVVGPGKDRPDSKTVHGACWFGPLKLTPGQKYSYEFQFRGSIPQIRVSILDWKGNKADSGFRNIPGGHSSLNLGSGWTVCKGEFVPLKDSEQTAIAVEFSGKLTNGAFVLIDKFRIADRTGNNLYAARSYIAPKTATKITRNPGEYIILFKGNSITRHRFNEYTVKQLGWDHEAGMAASAMENDYAHVLCRLIGRELPKMKVRPVLGAGNQYLLNDLAKFREIRPDLIVVQGGEHALASRKFAEYEKLLDTAFEEMKKITPRIICIGIWEPGRKYAGHGAGKIQEIQRKIAEKHRIPFVSVERFANDPACRGWGTSSGVKWHPNDLGMRKYAEAAFAAWRKQFNDKNGE